MKPSKTALFEAAKRWDAAAVKGLLKAAAGDLIDATDPKGRQALHIACAAQPARGLGETNGIATVTALLNAGAGLEAHVPMPAEEGDFRANPGLVRGLARPQLPLGEVSAQARRRCELFALDRSVPATMPR